MTDFSSLGLSEKLVARLADKGITKPTPIQERAIPLALEGRDIMGLAQTGTGKTAAFGLPLVQKMMSAGTKPDRKTVRGLVLAPTRELAKQIQDNLFVFTDKSHLKVTMVVGGQSLVGQTNRLARGTDILVATPGRLIDLLERKAVNLSKTEFLVLDEADQMLDLGFIHALRKIASLLPPSRQTMLFSATMPKLMADISKAYLKNPERVEVSPPGKIADKITQEVHFVTQPFKSELLIELLDAHKSERALVFARTKRGVEKLKKALDTANYTAETIHGNKSQGQRNRALQSFRDGNVKILIATDVAARGLDIPGVKHVYNYDMPNVPENYVHRIGRTARAGADGRAIAFCAPDEASELRAVQKVMKLTIPVASGRPWEGVEQPGVKPKKSGGGRRRGGGGGGQPRRNAGPNDTKPAGSNKRRRRKPKAKSPSKNLSAS